MADVFVEIAKDGVNLVVHPSTVDAHKRAGWKVVKEGVSLKAGKEKSAEDNAAKTDKTEGAKA